jgi:hypothetical protein
MIAEIPLISYYEIPGVCILIQTYTWDLPDFDKKKKKSGKMIRTCSLLMYIAKGCRPPNRPRLHRPRVMELVMSNKRYQLAVAHRLGENM